MARILKVNRTTNVPMLLYPVGYTASACGCRGCLGLGGDCVQATQKTRAMAVGFELSDGRTGCVVFDTQPTDLEITQAVDAWGLANPKDPLVGPADA